MARNSSDKSNQPEPKRLSAIEVEKLTAQFNAESYAASIEKDFQRVIEMMERTITDIKRSMEVRPNQRISSTIPMADRASTAINDIENMVRSLNLSQIALDVARYSAATQTLHVLASIEVRQAAEAAEQSN